MTKMGTAGASIRRVRLSECLEEIARGVGPEWRKYRVIGATRSGIAPAKESVGQTPERYKLVEPGTIFYNPMRILLGSIAMVDEGEPPGITSPDYVVFRTRPDVLHHRWFYHWLRSTDGAAFIKTLSRGAVRERMLFRRLASADIVIPLWDQQVAFAGHIVALERVRRGARDQLAAIDALPAALLRRTFNAEF